MCTHYQDGLTIKEKLEYPAYFQNNEFQKTPQNNYSLEIIPILYNSGGGSWGGCEDPRLTVIEDTVYLTYTAFDGWSSLRMAMTSIKLKDFLKKKWDWTKPILFSPSGEINKNWVLFPEKINGQYAILHSICPDILVDYFDNLDFKDTKYLKSRFENTKGRKKSWDDLTRGAGPPPIKTKKGWLLIYHAMDSHDPNRYKIGAMLLDLKDPSKIIARCKKPILEPDEHYENSGWKPGVAYCCGAIIKENKLFIYYGGADTVCCSASASLDKFLNDLIKTGSPKLKKTKNIKSKIKSKKKQ